METLTQIIANLTADLADAKARHAADNSAFNARSVDRHERALAAVVDCQKLTGLA